MTEQMLLHVRQSHVLHLLKEAHSIDELSHAACNEHRTDKTDNMKYTLAEKE
jgi:hypothetical protein